MAPVVKELQRFDKTFQVTVCLTAQHRELLDQVIDVFQIPVTHDLNLMAPNQSILDITCNVLRGISDILDIEHPDVVLVHGDTTTSFAAALASYYKKISAGHVEAGLRTQNKYHPFPEEINRRLADPICDYHYAPTQSAQDNLLREGISESSITITGNTVIDALLEVASTPYEFKDSLLAEAGTHRRLILVTAHRRESFGESFENMCLGMRDIVDNNADVEIVYPVHPNPNVRTTANRILGSASRVHLVDPIEYVPFVHLMKKSYLVLTDSGGVQEEAPSLGKPVLVMREVTERPEAIAAGTAMLVGTSRKRIFQTVQRLLDDQNEYLKMARAVNPYGDGKASLRIAEHLTRIAGSTLS